jgi:hypothetical protein
MEHRLVLAKIKSHKLLLLFLLLGLATAVVMTQAYYRCHGKPLSHEEAVARAEMLLQQFSKQHNVGETLPLLVEENYDEQRRSWMFRYRNSVCELVIYADRCHGTEVGGLNQGCTVR